jgi:hypothetical protein
MNRVRLRAQHWTIAGSENRQITHDAMSLNAGTKVGAYEVVALIGAGGMGELLY